MDGYKRFEEEVASVAIAFPGLEGKTVDGKNVISGALSIYGESGEFIDEYQIEIHPTPAYPNEYPLVYETGGRLPHNIDWHVYEQGHWCIGVGVEEELNCKKGITLVSFILNQVRSFLFNQTYKRVNGVFYRERSHGIRGILEYYMETLKLSDYVKVYKALYAAVRKEPKSNSKCFCGSNRKYRKCHRKGLRYIRKNANKAINRDYNRLKETILNHQNNK